MCKKTQFRYCPSTIDKCMKNFIKNLNVLKLTTYSCCCGHGKYPMTIIVKCWDDKFHDIVSGIEIPRRKRFYKKDKQGYYYIPEVSKPKSS